MSLPGPSNSNKRTASTADFLQASIPRKISKVHPFFQKSADTTGSGSFIWLDSLGSSHSCLHGLNLSPISSAKVAAFDLDGTLIKSEPLKTKATSPPHWEWWRAGIPAKLKDLSESGYAIVIVSNQALKPPMLQVWKQKILLIASALPNVPFRLFAATGKDYYRKPMPGMWSTLEHIYLQDGVVIDKTASFFVGDAAGRQYSRNKSDFSSTDRKWALNVGIPFLTPEEYFLGLPFHPSFLLPGFNVSSLPDLPPVTPTSSPILLYSPKQELILFVGYPCLGKTSFYRRHFQLAGYVHVNQDTLRTRDKCVKAAREILQRGKSCVIDNTNRDALTRKYYIDIAREHGISIRCFLFTGSIELAWHNNLYRAYNLPPTVAAEEPKRELIPYIGFTAFRDNYEEPQLAEGISEIKKVNWVFSGTEEERKCWSMWVDFELFARQLTNAVWLFEPIVAPATCRQTRWHSAVTW